MKEIISPKAIRIGYKAADWRDAVGEVGRLMLDAGIVEDRYVEAMINMVEENGAYMVVAPGVAMPHARAESGAVKTGIGFLILTEPVVFPNKESNPVKLLVGVSAVNKDEHLETFGRVAQLIVDENSLQKLMTCKTEDEAAQILNA